MGAVTPPVCWLIFPITPFETIVFIIANTLSSLSSSLLSFDMISCLSVAECSRIICAKSSGLIAFPPALSMFSLAIDIDRLTELVLLRFRVPSALFPNWVGLLVGWNCPTRCSGEMSSSSAGISKLLLLELLLPSPILLLAMLAIPSPRASL